MMYLNQASTTVSYGELLSRSFLSPCNSVEVPSIESRNEMVLIPSTSDPMSMQPIGVQLNITTSLPVDNSVSVDPHMVSGTPLHILGSEQNFQYQGLSLSLATPITSSVHVPSFQYHFRNPGLSSSVSSHVPYSLEDASQSKESINAEYLSFYSPEGTHNLIKVGALNTPQCSISPKDIHSGRNTYDPSDLATPILNSKYLKPSQQLLDEVVNVGGALKQNESDKHNLYKFGLDGSKESEMKSNSSSMLPLYSGVSSDPHELATNSSCEHSSVEQQHLQNRITMLLSMLEEVDRRYKQYYHQMQITVSSFEMIAGCGASKQYTALALQRISRHFRCLRDAINSQIQVSSRSLGEQDETPNGQGGVLSRLRYVDQQLRQQRALQQLRINRHSWRPQRGLPESSVSILRAWMFEHFLHPYPKDWEKAMLARQTGLTKSQVANWFINARVRLWKPMVEEMYKKEFCDLEAGSNSSPEHAPKESREKLWAFEYRGEELRESGMSTVADGGHLGQFNDLKSDFTPDIEMHGFTARFNFQNVVHVDDDIDSGMLKLQDDQTCIGVATS
ncbi:BEL1-like homeodomain protein 3 [Cornus florida]|uniref:BEL1-like homeodomain protein 3 n=1 Tax=Cornus florida TaxID=4283 RepID=UPI0028A09A2B|nr:BEL1-like homeodomain protein 3 [Cornus florida]XP_059637055.1 BEL1-like homeodomain protein 3 [Cornus florida]XP_059637056.1 BEL1-like homeodomain protein 3 [Cornus florida]